jgi:T5SS/PEP-CTERM-associated repeat protein
MIRSKLSSAIAIAAGAVFASPAFAALSVRTWHAPHGGAFTAREDWGPKSGIPSAKEGVKFDVSGAYTVTFPKDQSNTSLTVGRDKLNLKLNGHTYEITTPKKGGTIQMGTRASDNARITVTNGILKSSSAILANAALSHATATVTQNGLWTTRSLNVGYKGHGIVNVTAGGLVHAGTTKVGVTNKSTGALLLTSAGSEFEAAALTLANDKTGNGSIIVRDHASLVVDHTLDIRKKGVITLDNGSASAALFSNNGTVQAPGVADIQGNFINRAGGTVSLSGDQATFDGPVTHNGKVFKVGPHTTAIFNDIVNGAGAITGGGTLQFNDIYSPGNSPANVSITGDLDFGNTGTLELDLGTISDHLAVNGSVNLNDVTLNITNPAAILNQPIVLLTATHGVNPVDVSGFATNLPGGYRVVDAGSTPTQLAVMVVVPEPASLAMAGALGAFALLRRRRS